MTHSLASLTCSHRSILSPLRQASCSALFPVSVLREANHTLEEAFHFYINIFPWWEIMTMFPKMLNHSFKNNVWRCLWVTAGQTGEEYYEANTLLVLVLSWILLTLTKVQNIFCLILLSGLQTTPKAKQFFLSKLLLMVSCLQPRCCTLLLDLTHGQLIWDSAALCVCVEAICLWKLRASSPVVTYLQIKQGHFFFPPWQRQSISAVDSRPFTMDTRQSSDLVKLNTNHPGG